MPLAWTMEDLLALPEDADALVFKKMKELGRPAAEKLSRLKDLRSIDLTECSGLSEEVLRALAKLPKLRSLAIDTKSLPPGGIELVSKCSGVETLGIYGGKLDDQELKTLSGLAELRHLTLWGMGDVSDEGLGALSRLARLQKLTVAWSKGIAGAGFRVLKELKELKELKVTGFDRFALDGAKAIGTLGQLRALELYDCGVSDEKFGALSTLTNLESLSIYCDHRDSVKVTNVSLPVVKALPGLRSLSLNGAAVTKESLEEQVSSLKGRFMVY